MKKVLLEGIQPKEIGSNVSWYNFKLGRIAKPSHIENLLDLTVHLTDIITNFYFVAKGIDPNSTISVLNQRGLLEPDFSVNIKGNEFEMEIKKYFAGGCNRSSCFNYKIDVLLFSPLRERISQILSSYKMFSPLPLYFFEDI